MAFEAGMARLTIKEADLAAQGRYTVVATNAAGSDRTSCFLDVQSKLTAVLLSQNWFIILMELNCGQKI